MRLFKHNVQPISAFSFGKIFQLEVAGVQNRSSDLKLNKLYISYGKRQKSCTLIVIWVKCLYLTSPTFNLSSKSHRLFLLQRRKYKGTCSKDAVGSISWRSKTSKVVVHVVCSSS